MKKKRHAAIIGIIEDVAVETQEDLGERLLEKGFAVTQATISRDIKELKLTKIPDGTGKQKYAVLAEGKEKVSARQKRVFKEGVTGIYPAGNIMVIKTLIGMAMAVAASLDAMDDNLEIVGTIAGDDTIMSVMKTPEDVLLVIERLRRVLSEHD
ncbi:MAG: arginine repressor [Defluviitaleaceae bacterium]|nr:arginine repressor [Defluviitaleaceae bacterium]